MSETREPASAGTLEVEIAAFDAMRAKLEQLYNGKWVVFHGTDFVGHFDTFENAATEAVSRFGRGPYLIRQVGAPPLVLPASVMYRFENAADEVRV